MRKFLLLVICLVSAISAQTIMWETTVPFESDDDGPVGIDVAPSGDVLVACYTNGPNYSQWETGTNTLTSAPDTRLIKLDSYGSVVSSENLGILFNNGIKGVGFTDTGFTLIGNHASGNTNYIPSSAWQIYFENTHRDTIRYNSGGMTVGYWFKKMKNSFYHKPVSNLYYNDSFFKSSSGHDMLMDTSNQVIAHKTFIDFPDTLFVNNTEEFIYYFYINDFDQSENNDVFITGSISGMYLKYEYNYIVKLNSDRNVIWQIYYHGYSHPDSQISNYINSISSTSDGGCIFGVWKDLNDNYDVDKNENFLVKLNSEGSTEYSKTVENEIKFIHRIGENEYIYKTDESSDIVKVVDTGTELQEVWSFSFPNSSIIKPIENGFVSAGVKDNNTIILKVATGAAIEDTSIPTSTELYQNYPNPFNPTTSIRYALTHDADVKLTVFDIAGREVAELVSSRQVKGNYSVNFNAENLTSGIYFYRLSVGGKAVQSRKMMILK